MFGGRGIFVSACLVGALLFAIIQQSLVAQSNTVAPLLRFDDYPAARRAFADGQWAVAERWFGEFAERNPGDPRRVTAVLMQAQSQMHLGEFPKAEKLLAATLPNAGNLVSDCRYWIALAQFHGGKSKQALESFSKLADESPDTVFAMDCIVGWAKVLSSLQDWPSVERLLQPSDVRFRRLGARFSTATGWYEGRLLLAEALLQQDKPLFAATDLLQLGEIVDPKLAMARLTLLARAWLAAGKPAEALEVTDRLMKALASQEDSLGRGAALQLRAAAFQQLGKSTDALAIFEVITSTAVDERVRSLAQLRRAELSYRGTNSLTVATNLANSVTANAESATLLRITAGEMFLDRYLTGIAANDSKASLSNHLVQAESCFVGALTNSPSKELQLRAQLGRGWVSALAGRDAQSAEGFAIVTRSLPAGATRNRALLKWAETSFELGRWTNVVEILSSLQVPPDVAPVEDHRVHAAGRLLQVRATLQAGDLLKTESLVRSISSVETGEHVVGATLLLVEALRDARPADARRLIVAQSERTKDTNQLAELSLAKARTWMSEWKWAEAARELDAWLTNNAWHPKAVEAEFESAWLKYYSGAPTNAFSAFTNLAARYPSAPQANEARVWAADFLFNQKQYVDSEKLFQLVRQSTNAAPNMRFHAGLMAARASIARQGYADARAYLTGIIENKECPLSLREESTFMLADLLITEFSVTSPKPAARFEEAINALNAIVQSAPTNRVAALAHGRIADCHLQLAAEVASRYDKALESYQKVLDMGPPSADLTARSQAECGIALIHEKRAINSPDRPKLLRSALENYLNVFYGKRSLPTERLDPYWEQQSGLAAARLHATLGEFEQAVALFRRMQSRFPGMRPALEARIQQVEQQKTRIGPPQLN